MKIWTKLEWDIETGRVINREGFDYAGPIESLKKGSDTAKQAAATAQTAATGANTVGDTAQGVAKTNQGVQTSARSTAQPFASSLLPSKSGGLSPYANAQYGQAKTQNALEAQNERSMGLKALALRGFNNSPGATSSVLNTTNQRQGAADTGAYQNAMRDTLGEGLAGLNYFSGQQSMYDPNRALQTATGAYGAETGGANAMSNAAQVMNTSPTLLGDIGGGLMGLAGGASSIMGGLGSLGWKPLGGGH